MPILNSIISWFNVKRMHQIDLFRKYPVDVQRETLMKLLNQAESTEWGIKYGYESILQVEEYKERVPLQDYEELKKYVIRLRHGEQNILWSSNIRWFAKSSGTTSDNSKFIPVSRETLEECHFRGGKDILVFYNHQFPENNLFKGKGLALGGSRKINNFSNESYYGDLSAILIQNLPFWAEFIRTPGVSIALMEEWDKKIEQMAHATIKENVTNIAGVPSWTLVLLKHILQITGKKNMLDVWPNLELFAHGGVSFVPYREQFKKLIPSEKMNYMETYNASEGFFAIQDEPLRDDMLLMLDYGIFYEFIPLEKIHDDQPKTLTLDEVETEKNYAIVISTNSGLWRYIIGDTVKFTSKFPFRIKITGRTRSFINAFGEELIIDNAENALKEACEKTQAVIREYTAAPVYMSENQKGCHQWLFEFEKPPQSIALFVSVLDDALKSFNSDYEAKRYKNLTLDVPDVVSLEQGVFYEWLKKKGRLGGQNKIPRLANHREFADELLQINECYKKNNG